VQTKAAKSSRWFRKGIIAGAVMSVVVVVSLVATISSRESGVSAALATVFSSPTLRVVISAHTTNPQEQATVSQYSVVLAVTSENGRRPLSGADGVDDYELSVLRSGVDLGDVIIADHAVYVRVNVQAIAPNSYAGIMKSLRKKVAPGPAFEFTQALVNDQWVGVDDSTIESFVKSLGVAAAQPHSNVSFDGLRNAFTLSFAQSWDAWVSIHELSSSNGVTEYSIKLPVQHFVSTFVKDISGAILKEVPAADVGSVRSVLSDASSAINEIPAGLEIPMTMWVTNGSLSQLAITYEGNSLDLAISHPTVGVTVPPGALMLTTSIIHSLRGDFAVCLPFGSSPCESSSSSSGPGISFGSGSTYGPSTSYSSSTPA
jgi:hypothetical protein